MRGRVGEPCLVLVVRAASSVLRWDAVDADPRSGRVARPDLALSPRRVSRRRVERDPVLVECPVRRVDVGNPQDQRDLVRLREIRNHLQPDMKVRRSAQTQVAAAIVYEVEPETVDIETAHRLQIGDVKEEVAQGSTMLIHVPSMSGPTESLERPLDRQPDRLLPYRTGCPEMLGSGVVLPLETT
jgi:hypothetical protein